MINSYCVQDDLFTDSFHHTCPKVKYIVFKLIYYNYIIWKDMKQMKTDVTCNCIGNLFTNQQKYFLVKKNQTSIISSSIILNDNKSLKSYNLIRTKKSLKNKPKSNLSIDFQIFNQQLNEDRNINNHINRTALQRQFIYQKQEERRSRISGQFNCHPQHTDLYNKCFSLINHGNPVTYISSTQMNSFPWGGYKPQCNLQTTYRHFPSVNVINPENEQNDFKKYETRLQDKTAINMKLQQPHISHQFSSQIQNRNQILTQKNQVNQGTGSWLPRQNIEDALYIEGIEKKIKDKEQVILNHQKNDKIQLIPKVLKSKRLQKKQSFGRFVESDEENWSQSPHSQVIGKDFDINYQNFQQNQINIKQTCASCSTNTKLSQLKGNEDQTYFLQNTFGNMNHYKSYQNL